MLKSKTALVQELEDACNDFLGVHTDALPRVARRWMQPVLDAYVSLAKSEDSDVEAVTIFRYPTVNGLRAEEAGPDTDSVVFILYVPDTGKFSRRVFVRPPLPSLLGGRELSLEDIRELGVTPAEIVSYIKMACKEVIAEGYLKMATQKPARA
jgi:hypothetical protein